MPPLPDGIFAPGVEKVRMSQLDARGLQALRQAQVDLYAGAVERGWYARHPQQRGAGGIIAGEQVAALGIDGYDQRTKFFYLVAP